MSPTEGAPTGGVAPGVARLAALVRAGDLSPREAIDATLARIAAQDGDLNAFRVVLAERARAEADAAAERMREGGDVPLLGVPIAVKDDTDVGGEITTYGTAAVRRRAVADAPVVARLRAAGAIVVGKTNLPELALWGTFTESATFGRTANPHDLTRTPGGSSGGSASAVAAGLVPAATGTDGGASIRVPAALTGVVGVKPQAGTLGPPRWRGLLQDGFLTRTVEDAALLLRATTGSPLGSGGDGDGDGSRPLRIAVSTRRGAPWAPVSPASRRAVERVADLLSGLGHAVVERHPPYALVAPLAVPRMLRGVLDDALDTLDDLQRLEARTRTLLRVGRLVPPRLADALATAKALDRLGALFADHDLLLSPVTADTAPRLGQFDGRGAMRTYLGTTRFFATLPAWNLTGQPAASIPAGTGPEGLPLGVQLIARPHDHATLLAVAEQIQRATASGALR